MSKLFFKNYFLWGFLLWLFGYVLGIAFFFFVSPNLIGWVIMPIGSVVTLWVLFKKIHFAKFMEYFFLGLIWTLIAIIFDYFFLVKVFKPKDGYYKFDVYLYYFLTFLLPLLAGFLKRRKTK